MLLKGSLCKKETVRSPSIYCILSSYDRDEGQVKGGIAICYITDFRTWDQDTADLSKQMSGLCGVLVERGETNDGTKHFGYIGNLLYS